MIIPQNLSNCRLKAPPLGARTQQICWTREVPWRVEVDPASFLEQLSWFFQVGVFIKQPLYIHIYIYKWGLKNDLVVQFEKNFGVLIYFLPHESCWGFNNSITMIALMRGKSLNIADWHQSFFGISWAVQLEILGSRYPNCSWTRSI